MNLTYQQRLQVVNTVVEANEGKSPLIVGSGFFAMRDMENFMNDTSHLNLMPIMLCHTITS